MIYQTIAWLVLSFLVGFVIYLFPKLSRVLSLMTGIVSAVYAVQVFFDNSSLDLQLLDSFGVSLTVDRLSSFFILTNALVTCAVIIYCWQNIKDKFFYMQLIILHGSVNATFVCADFISLYVALEVISIGSFLLIAYSRTDRSIWVGLRYLFVSNVAMLFYLVGTILVYKAHNSFSYEGLRGSPPEAIALIFLGLLVKGGIFVSGLWLPLTHSESASYVSAMLSGVVVKAGVFPLVRCALLLEEIDPIVKILGGATAIFGVSFAIWQQDTKRTLAFSTISQLGFVMAAPSVGGFYALTHGLAKSTLFLTAGNLPSRNFQELARKKIDISVWLVLLAASLSISGFPILSGFAAKVSTSKEWVLWQTIVMNIATVGTVMTFAKFIFLPKQKLSSFNRRGVEGNQAKSKIHPGYWWAMLILLSGLIAANILYYEAYTIENTIKPLAIIALGWLAYLLVIKKLTIKLPRDLEQFDHLIGVMIVTLIFIFWIIWTRTQFLI